MEASARIERELPSLEVRTHHEMEYNEPVDGVCPGYIPRNSADDLDVLIGKDWVSSHDDDGNPELAKGLHIENAGSTGAKQGVQRREPKPEEVWLTVILWIDREWDDTRTKEGQAIPRRKASFW